jgi:hypothetical protein
VHTRKNVEDLDVTPIARASIDDADAFHRLMCGIRGVESGPAPEQALYEGRCPYRGLCVFNVDDAPFFFGREALISSMAVGQAAAKHRGQNGQSLPGHLGRFKKRQVLRSSSSLGLSP